MTLISLLLSVLLSPANAQAILAEDIDFVGRKVKTTSESRPIFPISQRSQFKRFEEVSEYETSEEMRRQRRMGIGAQAAGTTGLLGVMLELNFTPDNSAVVGFGGAGGYNTMNFQWKHQFNGRFFSPYLGIGYARWYNSADAKSLNKTTPNVITKFLSEEEKQSGKFEVDLLTPSFGLYYHMLSGPQVGVTYFGEVTLLTELSKPEPTPVAGVGALYFF